MKIAEKRNTILLADLATNKASLEIEKKLFAKQIDKDFLKEVLAEERFWNGYQAYNSLMREYGETDYKVKNQSEIKELKERIQKLQ